MRTVAFCEIEPYCRAVLRKHWPFVGISTDVKRISPPRASVIAAGFPCQDVSLSGPGTGLSGERSGLYWQVVRAVRMVRPRNVLLENVAELLGRGMGSVCGALAELGYDAEWDCLPTGLDLGHVRERIFIVADDMRERLERGATPERTHKMQETCSRGLDLPTFLRLRTPEKSGALDPSWAEEYMGFPSGWTESGQSETASGQHSRKSSAGRSCKLKD